MAGDVEQAPPGSLRLRELTGHGPPQLNARKANPRQPPERQRMLLLAYYGAFTHEQLAGKLNMPVPLVRSSLQRCLGEIDVCLSL